MKRRLMRLFCNGNLGFQQKGKTEKGRDREMGKRSQVASPELESVMRIAHEHITYASRYPEKLREIATRLNITEESALALAIADHIVEEFTLVKIH